MARRTFVVQFCPCGHTGAMTLTELMANGAGGQIEKIAEHKKLDAPILSSNKCRKCKEDCVDYTASMLSW